MFSAIAVLLLASAPQDIDLARQAIEEGRFEDAVSSLQTALIQGPHPLETHVRLYEQLGIAYAYLEQREQSLRAFEKLLALAPGHFLAYTISPKATFIFEEARRRSDQRSPATLQLSWPRGLRTQDAVPLTLEVVSDPMRLLDRLVVRTRVRPERAWSERTLPLPPAGSHIETELSGPLSATSSTSVEFYVTGLDQQGNEVLRVGREQAPRQVFLRYEEPRAWYQHWWVWAIAGVAAAGGVTAAAVLTRSPPDTVDGSLSL